VKKLLVSKDGELQFTAFATDLNSFLFGAPGTLLAEKKYSSIVREGMSKARKADKSRVN
jgi:hypothetical protein